MPSPVDLGSVADQELDHLKVAFLGCRRQRRRALAVRDVRRRVRLEEDSHNVHVVLLCRRVHGRRAVGRRDLNRRPVRKQDLDHVKVALFGGCNERCEPGLRLGVDLSALLEQVQHNSVVALACRRVQRRPRVLVLLVDVGSVIDEVADNSLVPVAGGNPERSRSVGLAPVDRRPVL